MTKQIGSGRGERELKVRVKDKKKSQSSRAWLERQLNDPYVARAKREGFRSRAAFKLIEIDDKHHLLKRGAKVVDLGAAPGGWSQVAAKRIGEKGHIVGIDLRSLALRPRGDSRNLVFVLLIELVPKEIASRLPIPAPVLAAVSYRDLARLDRIFYLGAH